MESLLSAQPNKKVSTEDEGKKEGKVGEKKADKYFYVSEGMVGRVDISISGQEIGLCTDEFTSCNIIFLYLRKRFVLIHADSSVDQNILIKEINWIRENVGINEKVNIRIFRRANNNDSAKTIISLLMDLGKKIDSAYYDYKNYHIEDKDGVIFVNSKEFGKLDQLSKLTNVEYHPKAALLFARHAIGTIFSESLLSISGHNRHLNPILYENKWIEYPQLELPDKYTEEVLQRYEMTANRPAFQLYDILAKRSLSAYSFNSRNEVINHHLGDAACVLSYFYLASTKNPSWMDFLNKNYVLFENSGEKNEDIDQIKQYKDAKEISELYVICGYDHEAKIAKKPLNNIVKQVLVIIKAHELVFRLNHIKKLKWDAARFWSASEEEIKAIEKTQQETTMRTLEVPTKTESETDVALPPLTFAKVSSTTPTNRA